MSRENMVPVVSFERGRSPMESVTSWEPNELMERFIERGVEWICFRWERCFEVDIPVEDDVLFVLWYANILCDCEPQEWDRDLLLNDGELWIAMEAVGPVVSLVVECAPGLSVSERKIEKVQMSTLEYRNAWSALASELVEHAVGAGP